MEFVTLEDMETTCLYQADGDSNMWHLLARCRTIQDSIFIASACGSQSSVTFAVLDEYGDVQYF